MHFGYDKNNYIGFSVKVFVTNGNSGNYGEWIYTKGQRIDLTNYKGSGLDIEVKFYNSNNDTIQVSTNDNSVTSMAATVTFY